MENDSLGSALKPMKQIHKKYFCKLCSKKFTSSSHLNRHLRSTHKLALDKKNTRIKCPFQGCEEPLNRHSKLRTHLANVHSLQLIAEEKTFHSREDFENWMKRIGLNTNVNYVLDTSQKSLKDGKRKLYYNCERSHSKRSGKQSRSSVKIGTVCPSRIEVEVKTSNDHYSIMFWKTHYGHSFEKKLKKVKNPEPGTLLQEHILLKGLEDHNYVVKGIKKSHHTRNECQNVADISESKSFICQPIISKVNDKGTESDQLQPSPQKVLQEQTAHNYVKKIVQEENSQTKQSTDDRTSLNSSLENISSGKAESSVPSFQSLIKKNLQIILGLSNNVLLNRESSFRVLKKIYEIKSIYNKSNDMINIENTQFTT